MINLPTTVILAGGLATRLNNLTKKIPKSLILIHGKPFIFHQINYLVKQGIKRILICVGHFGDQIETEVGDGKKFGIEIIYSYERNVLLGTGGAIKNALSLLDENFFVLYGDSWLEVNYLSFYKKYKVSNYEYLLTVFANKNDYDQSNIEIQNGFIVQYSKTKSTVKFKYIDYGLSILSQKIFSEFEKLDNFDLGEVYKKLVDDKKLGYIEVFNRFYEIGSLKGLEETRNHLKGLK